MVSASRAAVSRPTSSVAVPSQAGSLVASAVDLAGVVTRKPCQVVPWPVPVASGAASVVDVEAASEEETEVAFVAVSIVAAEASEAVTVDLADHQMRQADRVAGLTVTAETTAEVETVGAAADTVDATTTEDTAAEEASVEAIDPALGATPCRLVKGTAETETEVEIAAETAAETAAEIETETETADIVTATTAATTRGNDHTKEDQATKANANCAATDDKTLPRLVVGILSPLISLLSSSTSLASLTTRVSRQKQVFPYHGQLRTPCLKVKGQGTNRGLPTVAILGTTHPDRLDNTQKRVCHRTRRTSWSRLRCVNFALQRGVGRHAARVRTGSISPCKMTCVSCICQSRGGENWNSF